MDGPDVSTPARPVGRFDVTALREVVGGDTGAAAVAVDLVDVDHLSAESLELLVSMQTRGRVCVSGARWSQALRALLTAPLDEIANLAVLTRHLVESSTRA